MGKKRNQPSEIDPEDLDAAALSRRDALKRLGVLGLAIAGGPTVLAACGSSSKKSSSSTATTAAGTTDNAAEIAKLPQILGIDPANAGKGVAFKMGAVLALSGTGSFYGKTMSRGIDLAVKHIAQAGGPNITVVYKDHKSGDAQAGQTAITELGEAGVPAKLASYADDLGAMLKGTAQYKMFTMDGGGGTSIFAQKMPFFWGTRAITPNDPLPGLFQYLKQTLPGKTKVGLTGWDVGEPSNTIVKTDILKKISDAGFTFNGLYELTPVGSQDYSQVLPKIKSNEPDILLLGLYGQDPGSFLNQSLTSGIKAKMIGFEFTPDGVSASKGTYDSVGWTFTYDFFDANNPQSNLAKMFVSEFKKAYGDAPDFYAANYYEDTLNMWQVIARVLKKGGDPNKGEQLDAALQDNLTLTSVYGGDGDTTGSYSLDPVTHTVNQRTMGVFEYKSGKVTPKAFFNLNANNFKIA